MLAEVQCRLQSRNAAVFSSPKGIAVTFEEH